MIGAKVLPPDWWKLYTSTSTTLAPRVSPFHTLAPGGVSSTTTTTEPISKHLRSAFNLGSLVKHVPVGPFLHLVELLALVVVPVALLAGAAFVYRLRRGPNV